MMTTTSLVVRVAVLFTVGVFFSMVLELLLVQRQMVFSAEVLSSFFSSAWWIAPVCGAAAAMIGLLYPYLDKQLGEKADIREWSSVMRCVAVFVGINHAYAKIDFANDMQLSLSLAVMSVGLWWWFDRSGRGFGLGVGFAVLASVITQLLICTDVQRYTIPGDLFIHSWLPFVYFSGGVTMGFIGRQLAAEDAETEKQKTKVD